MRKKPKKQSSQSPTNLKKGSKVCKRNTGVATLLWLNQINLLCLVISCSIVYLDLLLGIFHFLLVKDFGMTFCDLKVFVRFIL